MPSADPDLTKDTHFSSFRFDEINNERTAAAVAFPYPANMARNLAGAGFPKNGRIPVQP